MARSVRVKNPQITAAYIETLLRRRYHRWCCFMTLYYFLSSRILILKHCDKAWHLYGTTRCLNTASRLLNRINTTQDEEEEEKAGPSAKHGHTAQDGMILWDWETKRVGVTLNQWMLNAEDFLREITVTYSISVMLHAEGSMNVCARE